ncbi:MAG: hypothetical protein NTY20_02055 [Candidatus Aenigmarchaeota archaeon]|nr:hypothetical protein [Candidatus Aenigmarchaeota archaeon]
MRAQASFEYMMVFALAIAFAIPVWVYVSSLQQSAGEELSMSYARNAVNQITSSADLVYTQGPPAKVRLNVYIPSRVDMINITNKTVNFRILSSAGVSDIFSTSVANLTGTLSNSGGMYWIDVESKGDYVQITAE